MTCEKMPPKKPISVCFHSRYHWTSINQDEQLVTQILQLGAIKALQKRAQQRDVIKGAPVELQPGEQRRTLRKYVICLCGAFTGGARRFDRLTLI